MSSLSLRASLPILRHVFRIRSLGEAAFGERQQRGPELLYEERHRGSIAVRETDQRLVDGTRKRCCAVIDRRGMDRVYGPRRGAAPVLGDFNGDGREDVMCHNVLSGKVWVDYPDAQGQFLGTEWTGNDGWCNAGELRRLYHGDFNGDQHTDLLCFDLAGGVQAVSLADTAGHFSGTSWASAGGWCNQSENRQLLVGDFNGDQRDDLLCHDRSTGEKLVDYANASGQFLGTNWSTVTSWCGGNAGSRLFVADFNGDGRDDLLCHNLHSGFIRLDYASASGTFEGTDWQTGPWCNDEGDALFVGDFDGNGRSDLLCHSGETGTRAGRFADASGQFPTLSYTTINRWGTLPGTRMFVGDVNGDGKDDLVAHTIPTGTIAVDYASSSGRFAGSDWVSSAGWCSEDVHELL